MMNKKTKEALKEAYLADRQIIWQREELNDHNLADRQIIWQREELNDHNKACMVLKKTNKREKSFSWAIIWFLIGALFGQILSWM